MRPTNERRRYTVTSSLISLLARCMHEMIPAITAEFLAQYARGYRYHYIVE